MLGDLSITAGGWEWMSLLCQGFLGKPASAPGHGEGCLSRLGSDPVHPLLPLHCICERSGDRVQVLQRAPHQPLRN